MKTTSPFLANLAAVVSLLGLAASSRAQGPLAPPGAPAPAMKTLAQVEPRFPVASAPVTLSQPGSYYLTTNLSGRVTISSDNVTLDLMGFTIETVPHNIALSLSGAFKNVCVRNGAISQGDTDGIGVSFSSSESDANGRVEALRVYGGRYGIVVGDGFTVRDCQVAGAGVGFRVTGNSAVRACAAERNVTGLQLLGAGAFVEDNVVRGNTNNYAFADGNRLNLLLCEIPQTLSWPCSVRLAGTLSMSEGGTNGITVCADDVTINLAGHALIGPGANSGSGIFQNYDHRGLRVVNGMIREWRGSSGGGIEVMGDSGIIQQVHACSNYFGIHTGASCVIVNCTARGNEATGIAVGSASVLSGCTSTENGLFGYDAGHGCVASSCSARGNMSTGFDTYEGRYESCFAFSNGGDGFSVHKGVIKACEASYNTGDGFYVVSSSSVVQCSGRFNGRNGDGAGIHIDASGNRIEQNYLAQNDRGIDVDQSGNFIAGNIAKANTVNWSVVSGNVCYVVNAVAAGAISGDSGGTSPGSADPNANFTY